MHALAEPPVSPTVIGADERDRPVLDQRRVVVRLRDGETILKRADVGEGDWPMLGDRFINPDAIVSVDVLRWS